MPILTPNGSQVGLHKLMAFSTMLSPTHHNTHLRPLIQAGGGESLSEPPQQLYLCHAILDCLQKVYDDLRGADSTLGRTKLEVWLTAVQDQTIVSLDKEEYKFEEFLQTVYYGRGLESIKEPPKEKDLSRPLSNYYISSSHNTFLSGNQLASKSTTGAYKNVLLRGCRCVEIDVHNGEVAVEKSSSSSSENLTPAQTSRGSSPAGSKPKHKRHISESTFSRGLASVVEKIDGKYGNAKSKWSRIRATSKSTSPEERGRKLVVPVINADMEIEKPVTIKELMNGEPLVLHGWTLTAPVGFRAVCKTIREDGFKTSSLPIIVSLEVHADMGQQQVMVDIMKEEWAGLLVEAPNEGCNPNERLPKLEDLQHKILVKVKKAIADKQDLTPANTASTLSPMPTKNDADSVHSGSEDDRSAPKKKVKICEALSNLGIYTHSEHFVSFEAPSAKTPPHIFSIGESQILDLHEKSRNEMFSHNRDFFMRAYPAGFRIDSSNLDPSIFWRKGVQMVALNWQTLDEGMMLNEGMFAGERGWALKPPGYRSDASEAINYKTVDLKITVFAGQHIPIPSHQTERGFHPYVRCELHVEKEKEQKTDHGGEIEKEEYKKKTPYSKGDHPDWGSEGHVMAFPTIGQVVEELSFVRVKVEDSRIAQHDLAAWACIRLDRLQQGYRFVHLFDTKGQATAGLLFVKIEKKVVNWK